MPASNLIERVSDLIALHQPAVPPSVRSQLTDLQDRLREPVRVAVVGRVKAGKSTMVNALLGQRVAPTDVSECTKVVTWFRYGRPQRVVVECHDGSTIESQLTEAGTLPDDLGVPAEDVSSVLTYLANEALKSMTLIDTPGIGSVHEQVGLSTRELLAAARDSAAAAAKADAVIFLLNPVMLQDELDTLNLFQAAAAESGEGSAANAVGVLSRADQLGDGRRDSWEVAVELAGRYASRYRREVAAVVPVIGLLAETAETAALTEMDVKQLGLLAAMEPGPFDRLLWTVDRFVSAGTPVPPTARERLLAHLDLYGVRWAVASLRSGTVGAAALRRALSAVSGVAEVKRMLTSYFREQDHVLKVRSALLQLHRLSFGPSGTGADRELRALRADVEALRLDPVMQPVAELAAWHDCCTGRVVLPEALLSEMQRLFAPGSLAGRLGAGGDDPAALARIAEEAMVRWRTYMVSEASPAAAKVARVVLRSYQMAWQRAQ